MQKHKNKIGILTTNSLIQCKERGALTFEVCNLIHIFSIQRFPLKCQVFKKRDFLLLENLCHLNSSYCLIPVLLSLSVIETRSRSVVRMSVAWDSLFGWESCSSMPDLSPMAHSASVPLHWSLRHNRWHRTRALEGRWGCDVFRLRWWWIWSDTMINNDNV